MDELSIYFANDSDIAELEAISKGYRTDVFVKINESIYSINIYTMNRLTQDFQSEVNNYGFYAPEPNLVIVVESKKNEIIETVKKIFKQQFFNDIKPVENIDTEQLYRIY